jgi:hypothetical protein
MQKFLLRRSFVLRRAHVFSFSFCQAEATEANLRARTRLIAPMSVG